MSSSSNNDGLLQMIKRFRQKYPGDLQNNVNMIFMIEDQLTEYLIDNEEKRTQTHREKRYEIIQLIGEVHDLAIEQNKAYQKQEHMIQKMIKMIKMIDSEKDEDE